MKSRTQDPSRFFVFLRSSVAEKLRWYCFKNNLQLGHTIEEAVIDFLISIGDIPSRESLDIQEQMEK